MCQNTEEAFERKSWLHGVVGGGRHIPPGGIFFFFSFGQRKKKITYLSSFLKTAGVGLGDSVRLPLRVELYQHLLDECINEEKILK